MADETKDTVSHETDSEEKEPVSSDTVKTEEPKDEPSDTKADSDVLAKLDDVIEKVNKVIDVVTVLAEQTQEVSDETEEKEETKPNEDTLEDYENLL